MPPVADEPAVVDMLRHHGARFAFVHGSRVTGSATPASDLDVAAWWGRDAPAPWDVVLPDGVDLLVLDGAPLELAGRVALHGRLLFDDAPPERVAWQARTRLVYLDEADRQRHLDAVYLAGRRRG
ncbi:MAG: nucleotidyltransferase domain-containing protein [Acidimicrobiales bacterium]